MTPPVRTCIGCRSRLPAAELVRVVWDEATGRVIVDVGRRLPGRGAWLHSDAACLATATKRKAFGRALRRLVAPDAVPTALPTKPAPVG